MWFKNIRFLSLQTAIPYQPDILDQQLNELVFQPCPKSLPATYGWVPPLGEETGTLVFGQSNTMLFRLRIEEKILPPAVVREHLNQEIKSLQQSLGRRIYKDEKERLKDEVYQTLLNQAFTKSTYINGYIDTEKQWLVVDCASSKKLVLFVTLFNKCVNNHCYTPELNSVSGVLTHWLHNNSHPSRFNFSDACLIKAHEENGSIARFKNQDLQSDVVQAFLNGGCFVTQSVLEWCDQIRFTLKEDFAMSNIKFLESVKDLARDGLGETLEERFAADFLIMSQTLREFLQDLLTQFTITEQTEKSGAALTTIE